MQFFVDAADSMKTERLAGWASARRLIA